MPELEPITREEMFLDGQDLEPITREEMFIKRIYDKTQVVPEPITRHEMFLKKAGEGGSDVDIVQLNVTENGTYSEQGKAYSPVIVSVPAPPLPDNAYLLKEVEDLPKDIATFSDGANLPLPSLKISIEPIQSGSGDPSPNNERPISGFTEGNVHVADGEDPHVVDNVTTISWEDEVGTVYGGTLDVVSGVLTVTHKKSKISDLSWNYNSSYNYFNATISDMKNQYTGTSDITKTICSSYKYKGADVSWANMGNSTFGINELSFRIKDTQYNTVENFLQGVGEQEICYELATPTTYQLSPTAVFSLLGVNNVWADTNGEILECQYWSKEA